MKVLDELLLDGVQQKVFSGVTAWVGVGGYCVYEGAVGNAGGPGAPEVKPETLFDLASLTKILGTGLVMMRLVAAGLLKLETPLWHILPEWRDGMDREKISVRHLLEHSSGLPAHRAFYRDLASVPPGFREGERLRRIRCLPLESVPGERVCYSDIAYMLLKRAAEIRGGEPFASQVMKALPPAVRDDIFFLPARPRSGQPVSFAATGFSFDRHCFLQGEVHDENAAVMGGVDGQAGLWGTAAAVGKAGCSLLAAWQGEDVWLPPSVVQSFICWPEEGRRPPAFDRPSGTLSACGRYFSRKTVGHLGFTGTSLWMDMEKKIVVVLLSNRVYYGNLNWKIRSFRPRFHDKVVEALGKG
ncbi:beta-lactamase family protein [Desulfobotulus sp. H1]|uniref:Beta-lactamase family protein n=1 Tax=Desulfobotulus pelophilus TaxID=2823377 RepID=A0ABT3NCA7_9BACT|nr:beta-lactamase family protein [Desulfobotulus pelophilus]